MLISAPIARSASRRPRIMRSNGEKFAICVFAFATRSPTNPDGSSIIMLGPRGSPNIWPLPLYFLITRPMKKRRRSAIAKATNTPITAARSGTNAVIAEPTNSAYCETRSPFTVNIGRIVES